MTTTSIENRVRRKVVVVGLLLGVTSMVGGAVWGTLVSVVILWTYLGKKERTLSKGDIVRLSAAWLLAVMVCNVLMNVGAFKEGLIAGWNAGSYWHPKS